MTPLSPPPSRTPRGRELDALVAEQVMGWKLFEVGYLGTDDETPEQRRYAKALERQGDHAVGTYAYIGGGKVIAYDNGFCDLFRPSTDISAAWLVVEKLRAEGWWFSLVQDNEGIWDVCFWQGEPRGGFPRVEFRAHEAEAPRSICLAALELVAARRSPEAP